MSCPRLPRASCKVMQSLPLTSSTVSIKLSRGIWFCAPRYKWGACSRCPAQHQQDPSRAGSAATADLHISRGSCVSFFLPAGEVTGRDRRANALYWNFLKVDGPRTRWRPRIAHCCHYSGFFPFIRGWGQFVRFFIRVPAALLFGLSYHYFPPLLFQFMFPSHC